MTNEMPQDQTGAPGGPPSEIDWDTVVPVKTPVEVSVDLLHFDVTNPRFTPDKRPTDNTDASIIEKLAATADLSELTRSISTSGYINIEPMVVVVRDNTLVVLEGNRRLAALKALRSKSLAAAAKVSSPNVEKSVADTFESILVFRVEKEEDARELIGFKHINGPQSWDAYAKAVFAARWLMSQPNEGGLTLQNIADRMGDNHATIHRMVTAYFVLQQAEDQGVYSIDDRVKKSFSFSHLYTGLSYPEFTDYLGMRRPSRNEDPDKIPVSEENKPKLRQLLVWLYGSKSEDVAPVVQSQNPDLGRLRDVLGSKAATKELETKPDLVTAVVSATPKHVRFSRHIVEANANLLRAQETLDGFDPVTQSELDEIVNSIFKRASVIRAGVQVAMSESAQVEFAADALAAVDDAASIDTPRK
ncbi:hypothetical protein N7379_20075 [Rhizobium pusense]|uniref:hypothetical protein n=1 Tax=Agrobacterium pusense TaxID=648995 RepID=UPI00244AEDDD|nr:hypothetical protein [Agrobacterium pusense]MDH0116792.1 hypothetical protein [Agrobacterium pusense]